MATQHVLITGVSSGIGHAAAAAFVDKGYGVFGTVRTTADELLDRLMFKTLGMRGRS
jgi:NAD(P)-dependent dehydrogenase (short-subunit alcohol dehydrogenase family)